MNAGWICKRWERLMSLPSLNTQHTHQGIPSYNPCPHTHTATPQVQRQMVSGSDGPSWPCMPPLQTGLLGKWAALGNETEQQEQTWPELCPKFKRQAGGGRGKGHQSPLPGGSLREGRVRGTHKEAFEGFQRGSCLPAWLRWNWGEQIP